MENKKIRARAHAHKFPNVPLNTYNAIYFLSIALGLSVLHMHETMIKIVCWLSFVFKFYVVFYTHKMCARYTLSSRPR